ncbi:MAG: hypothetical protein IPL96_03955 [Holophagaceae bacterium]|nr:hypothetical protein [Holophagaceae bacterium]
MFRPPALLLLAGTVLAAQDFQLPPYLPIPEGLELKPEGQETWRFDQERFDVRNAQTGAWLKIPIQGMTSRFLLRPAGGQRLGTLVLQQAVQKALEAAGWTWEWKERGIAKYAVNGREAWLSVKAAGSGELKVVVVEKADPPTLTLRPPGTEVEPINDATDFPYVLPSVRGKLLRSLQIQNPEPVRLADGTETLATMTMVEKQYELERPVSNHEFLSVMQAALKAAGWVIEGTTPAPDAVVQAVYLQKGRELRATLRNQRTLQSLAVTDVGAQLPKPTPRGEKP